MAAVGGKLARVSDRITATIGWHPKHHLVCGNPGGAVRFDSLFDAERAVWRRVLDQWRIHAGTDLNWIVKRSVVVGRHNVEPIERLRALLQPLEKRARIVVICLRQSSRGNGRSSHSEQEAGAASRAELLYKCHEVGE